jgi:NAD(P) transhydrogenase subunit beta
VTIEQLTQLIYLISAGAFILSLKWMSDPSTARRGVFAGVGAMVLAVAGTLLYPKIVAYHWILIAMAAGTLVGVPLSWVPLTAVPQRTALSHAFGGLAAGLVGTAKYYTWLEDGELTTFRMAAIGTEVLLGYLTCTGSLMAAGKLQEILPTRPLTYRNQNVINLGLLAVAIVISIVLVFRPGTPLLFPMVIVLSLLFGVLLVLPIGGADMPTVISLLNSYAGLSAVAMGFVLENKLLITAGALDGSSGLILSIIMCRAIRGGRPGAGGGRGDRAADGEVGDARRRDAPAREREHGRVHPRLRHGGRAGAAPGPGSARRAGQAGRRREVRDPPGRRPDARSHERAARRGGNPLREPRRDG